jgi:iron uptake system EfeUOB component EfeO/EfeM
MFNSKEYQELTHNFKFMDNKYKGMTVNERLWASGLMAKFEKAIKEKDVIKARWLLEKVELTKENIDPILEKHGLIPET